MVNSSERQPNPQFSALIEGVAQRLARGLSPFSLEQEGEFEEAQLLRLSLGILDENNLMGEAQLRAEQLRQTPPTQMTFSDPEANINQMHQITRRKWSGNRILAREADHEWRGKLRRWNRGRSPKSQRLQQKAAESIAKLKEMGLWEIMENGRPLSSADIDKIRKVTRQFKRKADLDSKKSRG